jgi:hypothetical protein
MCFLQQRASPSLELARLGASEESELRAALKKAREEVDRMSREQENRIQDVKVPDGLRCRYLLYPLYPQLAPVGSCDTLHGNAECDAGLGLLYIFASWDQHGGTGGILAVLLAYIRRTLFAS